MSPRKCIHVWAPGVVGSEGGIQAYSEGIVNDLRSADTKFQVRLVTRNDRSPKVKGDQSAGWLPRRLRAIGFALIASTLAWKDRPDLILLTHLHFSPIASLLKTLFGIPFVVTLHGGEAWKLRSQSERRALKNATALLPVSQFTAEQVQQKLSLPPTRFHLLRNTADDQRFHLAPKPKHLSRQLGISANTPVIFCMGRLESNHRYKRMDSVISAAASLIREGLTLALVIGGDGDDRERLKALAESEGIADQVYFTGKIPPEQLPDYYHLADVFALPSTGEGFGIVYLEALFSGCPVIAGNCGGAMEAVDHGKLGLAVDPDHLVDLSYHLRLILENRHPHPLFKHRETIREESLKRFGPRIRRELVHTLFEQLTHE